MHKTIFMIMQNASNNLTNKIVWIIMIGKIEVADEDIILIYRLLLNGILNSKRFQKFWDAFLFNLILE